MTSPLGTTPFGTGPDGQRFQLVALGPTRSGLRARITDLGASLVGLDVPDRDGRSADVVLGYDTASGYLSPANRYLGASVGRVANRIARGRFELAGRGYELVRNEGAHHLHGGGAGAFHRRRWQLTELTRHRAGFRLRSADGEEGYPGTLEVAATYTLEDDRLTIAYTATTDAPTPVSLTNHAYLDLDGAGDVRDHEIRVLADSVLATDGDLLPTGEVVAVAGGPLDLRQAARVGDRLPQLASTPAAGFDHCYALARGPGELRTVASVRAPVSGRVVELATTEPGLQLYSGQHLPAGLPGKAGRRYGPFAGLCLEAQGWPDAVNRAGFPSVILRPGVSYEHLTRLTFTTR